jgi:hypothetical protein
MRLRMTLFALLVATAALPLPAQQNQQNPFLGRWNITGTFPDTEKIYFLEVKQNGAQLEGLFLNRSSHATPVAWIRVEGEELVWQYGPGETLPKPACGPIFRAKLVADQLIGSHTLPGEPCPSRGGGRGARAGAAPKKAAAPPKAAPRQTTIYWVGLRQPVWPASNANGNHTYGTPVVLVGPGVGTDVWTGLTAGNKQNPNCVDRWSVENGVWKNAVPAQGEAPTCNPYSKLKFGDFKVEAEFKMDQGQNSGFYIRGRYELQMSLGNNPNSAYPGQFMDIYGWKRSDTFAAGAPGEWQTLEAVVVGNRITVKVNDKTVHDNAVLPAFTGGALDAHELAPGPIMIQGDHSRVEFRKMVVTPITKPGM